jgi:HEPN domain-containing protein
MKPLTEEWVAKAEGDFNSAGRELRARNVPNYDLACFCAQQCAEKYLKAYLQELDIRFGKTHDLGELLDPLVARYGELELLRSAAKDLSEYAVVFRYPGKTADKARARQAVQEAKLIRETIRTRLGLRVSEPQERRRRRSRRGARQA